MSPRSVRRRSRPGDRRGRAGSRGSRARCGRTSAGRSRFVSCVASGRWAEPDHSRRCRSEGPVDREHFSPVAMTGGGRIGLQSPPRCAVYSVRHGDSHPRGGRGRSGPAPAFGLGRAERLAWSGRIPAADAARSGVSRAQRVGGGRARRGHRDRADPSPAPPDPGPRHPDGRDRTAVHATRLPRPRDRVESGRARGDRDAGTRHGAVARVLERSTVVPPTRLERLARTAHHSASLGSEATHACSQQRGERGRDRRARTPARSRPGGRQGDPQRLLGLAQRYGDPRRRALGREPAAGRQSGGGVPGRAAAVVWRSRMRGPPCWTKASRSRRSDASKTDSWRSRSWSRRCCSPRSDDVLAKAGRSSNEIRSFAVMSTFDDIGLTVSLEHEGVASHPVDDDSGSIRCLNLHALAARLDVELSARRGRTRLPAPHPAAGRVRVLARRSVLIPARRRTRSIGRGRADRCAAVSPMRAGSLR